MAPVVGRLLLVGVVTVEDLPVLPVLRSMVPRLLVELLLPACGATEVLRELVGVLRLTCGVAEALRELLELLRLTCGVAELPRLTDAADELLVRETAADWLLLELPPCERPRPCAEASDAPMIRHPMSAKLIIKFLTEVFIIVNIINVQQVI